MVAASDHPVMEFQTKRHKLSPTLFSGDLMNRSDECDKFKKQIPKASRTHETEEITTTIAETLKASFPIKEEGRCNPNPPMAKQTVATLKQQRPNIVRIKLRKTETKFQIIPETTEKKVNDDDGVGFYNDQGVAHVMRMKKILETGGDEWVMLDLLTKLHTMGLSIKTLETTRIGITVGALKEHHGSPNVRRMAVKVVNLWKDTMVKELIKKQSSRVAKQTSNEVKPNMHSEKKLEGFPKTGYYGEVMKSIEKMESENIKSQRGKACPTETKFQIQKGPVKVNLNMELEGSKKDAKIGNGTRGMDISMEKLEATKRKLQEGYEKMKKKRRIQVMEVHEVTEQGLLPKETPRNNPNRRKVYWR